MENRVGLERSSFPDKDSLLDAYRRLYKMHPKHLLSLETNLPCELQPHSRDRYRIIMTMILSERSNDYNLSKALGKLFQRYPDFGGLRSLSKQQIIERILASRAKGGCGFGGYNKPNGGGNDDRLYSFINLYFNAWGENITERNISDLKNLPPGSGFGPKFVRTLLAYCPLDRNEPADKDVLPLDNPAFAALNDCLRERGQQYNNVEDARKDIENKLGDEKSISLIDFHELLRFRGQTGGRSPDYFNKNDIKVIIGWNAWRLLCSLERAEITEDWKWIYEHLVKDKSIAQQLGFFFRQIADPW